MKCTICQKEFKKYRTIKQCSIECRLKAGIEKKSQCWIWKVNSKNCRYGSITVNGYSKRVHRVSYETFKGKIPDNLIVCHNCPGGDNPLCINPDHLWLGTWEENMIDASSKGRMNGSKKWTKEKHQRLKEEMKTWNRVDNRGENSSRSKLKESDIPQIRELLNKGLTHKEIGDKFGVSKHAIGNINLNRRWSHI